MDLQLRLLPECIVTQPAVEGPWPDALLRKQQGQGDDLTWVQVGPRIFGHVGHQRIDANEQGHDKIVGGHANVQC